jgi:hypothetical protein
MDDDFIMGTDLGDDEGTFVDEVEVFNSERLLLIKIHTQLIK